jgi:hypothetical protein
LILAPGDEFQLAIFQGRSEPFCPLIKRF